MERIRSHYFIETWHGIVHASLSLPHPRARVLRDVYSVLKFMNCIYVNLVFMNPQKRS
jgi:hypothetical protein